MDTKVMPFSLAKAYKRPTQSEDIADVASSNKTKREGGGLPLSSPLETTLYNMRAHITRCCGPPDNDADFDSKKREKKTTESVHSSTSTLPGIQNQISKISKISTGSCPTNHPAQQTPGSYCENHRRWRPSLFLPRFGPTRPPSTTVQSPAFPWHSLPGVPVPTGTPLVPTTRPAK